MCEELGVDELCVEELWVEELLDEWCVPSSEAGVDEARWPPLSSPGSACLVAPPLSSPERAPPHPPVGPTPRHPAR